MKSEYCFFFIICLIIDYAMSGSYQNSYQQSRRPRMSNAHDVSQPFPSSANKPILVPITQLRWSKIGDNANVSGFVHSGELFGFIGIGEAKTDLLHCVSCSCRTPNGMVQLNGKRITTPAPNFSMIEVHHFDQLYNNLTVLETLIFSAEMRDPDKTHPSEMKAVRLLGEFSLNELEDCRIGDLVEWQKRAILFCTEVIAPRSVLFIDQPTRDLDSPSALALVSVLKRSTRKDRLVAVSFSSLTFREYALLDRIQLLTDNGSIYFGTGAHAVAYFASVGRTPFSGESVADFIMDLVNTEFVSAQFMRDQDMLEENALLAGESAPNVLVPSQRDSLLAASVFAPAIDSTSTVFSQHKDAPYRASAAILDTSVDSAFPVWDRPLAAAAQQRITERGGGYRPIGGDEGATLADSYSSMDIESSFTSGGGNLAGIGEFNVSFNRSSKAGKVAPINAHTHSHGAGYIQHSHPGPGKHGGTGGSNKNDNSTSSHHHPHPPVAEEEDRAEYYITQWELSDYNPLTLCLRNGQSFGATIASGFFYFLNCLVDSTYDFVVKLTYLFKGIVKGINYCRHCDCFETNEDACGDCCRNQVLLSQCFWLVWRGFTVRWRNRSQMFIVVSMGCFITPLLLLVIFAPLLEHRYKDGDVTAADNTLSAENTNSDGGSSSSSSSGNSVVSLGQELETAMVWNKVMLLTVWPFVCSLCSNMLSDNDVQDSKIYSFERSRGYYLPVLYPIAIFICDTILLKLLPFTLGSCVLYRYIGLTVTMAKFKVFVCAFMLLMTVSAALQKALFGIMSSFTTFTSLRVAMINVVFSCVLFLYSGPLLDLCRMAADANYLNNGGNELTMSNWSVIGYLVTKCMRELSIYYWGSNIFIFNELGPINDSDLSDYPYDYDTTTGGNSANKNDGGVSNYNTTVVTQQQGDDATSSLQSTPLGTGFIVTEERANVGWYKMYFLCIASVTVYVLFSVALHRDTRIVLSSKRKNA